MSKNPQNHRNQLLDTQIHHAKSQHLPPLPDRYKTSTATTNSCLLTHERKLEGEETGERRKKERKNKSQA